MNGIVVIADENKGSHADTLAATITNHPLADGQVNCVSESLWSDGARQIPVSQWANVVAAKARSVAASVLAIDVGLHKEEFGALKLVEDLASQHHDVVGCLKAIALFSRNYQTVLPSIKSVSELVQCEVKIFDRNQQRDDLITYVVKRAIGITMKD